MARRSSARSSAPRTPRSPRSSRARSPPRRSSRSHGVRTGSSTPTRPPSATSTSGTSVRADKQANRRIRLLLLGFVLVFGAVFARAVYLQGLKGPHFAHIAQSQHRQIQKTPAGRGTIFDRTGVQL